MRFGRHLRKNIKPLHDTALTAMTVSRRYHQALPQVGDRPGIFVTDVLVNDVGDFADGLPIDGALVDELNLSQVHAI
jgi:hypothetical protein